MRSVPFKIERETYEDQRRAGRYNPCLEITFRDKTGIHTHKISAGERDEISAFREGQETFVLSLNRLLDYVGLEIFQGSETVTEPGFGPFLQSEQDILEMIGPKGLDYAEHTIVSRLAQYAI